MARLLTRLRAPVLGDFDSTIAVKTRLACDQPIPVRIDDEIMLITGGGLDCPVHRGVYWTHKHQHAAGAQILLLEEQDLPKPPTEPAPTIFEAPEPPIQLRDIVAGMVVDVPMVDPESTRLGV